MRQITHEKLVFAGTILPNGPITQVQHDDAVCYARGGGMPRESLLIYFFPYSCDEGEDGNA